MGEAIITRPMPSVISHDLKFQDGYIIFNNIDEYHAFEKSRNYPTGLRTMNVGLSAIKGAPTIELYIDGSFKMRYEFDPEGIYHVDENGVENLISPNMAKKSTESFSWSSDSTTTKTITFKQKPALIQFFSYGAATYGYPTSVYLSWVIGGGILKVATEQTGTSGGTSTTTRNSYLLSDSVNSITENADGTCTIIFCSEFNRYMHNCYLTAIY